MGYMGWEQIIIQMYLFEILLIVLIVSLSAQSVNRVHVTGSQEIPVCSLRLVNTHEIIDLRTDCDLSNAKNGQLDNTLLKLIRVNASYLIKDGKTVRGYRYFKDPHNYKFKEYDFNVYHQALQHTLQQLQLPHLSLPFEEKYELVLGWYQPAQVWRLQEMFINYTNPIQQLPQVEGYQVKSWLEQKSSERSIALRKLGGKGPSQAVNITLELAIEDDQKINPGQCQVVIQEILPEWFFVDYDCLHTLAKYEVFDIELPEHFAKQYFFKYTVPMTRFKKTGAHRYDYQYKMGVRYPRPTNDDTYYVHVGLQPNDRITIECQGQQTMEVEEDLLNDRGHGTMFAGRAQDTKRVTMITFLLMIVLSVVAVKAVRVPKEDI